MIPGMNLMSGGPTARRWGRIIPLLSMVSALLGPPTAASAHQTTGWEPQRPMAAPQGGLAVVSRAGRVLTFGGFTDDFAAPVRTAQAYDPRTRRWTLLPPLPTARGDAAAAAVGHRVYVIGGYGAQAAVTTVEVLDLHTNRWSTGPSLPAPLAGAAAVAAGHRIYVIGGYDKSDEAVRTVQTYDTRSRHWSTAAPMAVPRGNLRAVRSGGRVYAIGGADTAGVSLAAAEVFKVGHGRGRWHTVASMRVPREGHGLAAGEGGRIYAIAGVDGSGDITPSAEVYDPRHDRWSQLPPLPTDRARAGMGAAPGPRGSILAVGGFQVGDTGVTATDLVDALGRSQTWTNR